MRERVGRLIGEAVEGMPWLGTFHSIGAQDAPPPCRAGRPAVQFHHPRHRRPAAPAEAADRRRRRRRETLARAAARRADRPLEEQRLDPGPGRCRRERGLRQRQGREALRRSTRRGCTTLNACDFGDLLLHMLVDPARPTATCSNTISSASNISSSTNIRTPTRASISGCACSRRSARTSAASATTTSRSIHGAAQKSPISCGSKRIFLARRSSGSSRITARPRNILAAASGLIAQNSGRLGKTLWTEQDEGEKVQVIGVWDGPEEARRVGEEIETIQRRGDGSRPARRLRDPRPRPVPDPRVRGPVHRHRPALPDRRRLPLLRARRDPRRARLSARHRPARRRPRLRADRQHRPSAASATRRSPSSTASPAPSGIPLPLAAAPHPRHATS